MRESHNGPILIADITGYSRFLNESELIHAEQTLSALLELLVKQTRPPLVVSKLEGDAVFSYSLSAIGLQGQAFVESIEGCYVEFRKALELMVLNTTCTCNACANISSLDLKFFVHHGEFVVGEAAGRSELHGRDVNLVHRLLKNDVVSTTGIAAYAMFTEDAVSGLGLGAMTEAMTLYRATYADIGEVTTWIEDLAPVWERSKIESEATFTHVGMVTESATIVTLPLDVVWGHLLDIEFRQILVGADRMDIRNVREGRAGEGAEYRCWHGGRETIQLIVDWKPMERIVTRDSTKMGGALFTFQAEYLLEPVADGTRLVQRASVADGPIGLKSIMRQFFPRLMASRLQRDIDDFGEAIKSSYDRRAAATRESNPQPSD